MRMTRRRGLSLALIATAFFAGTTVSDSPSRRPDPKPFQGWDQSEQRGCTRLIYFHKTSPKPWDSSPGEAVLEYGLTKWKDKYAAHVDKILAAPKDTPKAQRRWRLGVNHWTNLDTSFPLDVGGVSIPAGYHYVIIDMTDAGTIGLRLLDPKQCVAQQLDAWHVNRRDIPDGPFIPMQHEKVDEIEKTLKVDFAIDKKDHKKATLTVAFGPYRLTTNVVARF